MTTNSPNPVDGDVQALIDWLKPQIAELENICDELPFGLDEDDAMQLKVMRFALDRLNATAQPVSNEPSLKAMMRALDTFYAHDDVPETAMLKAFRILLADVMPPAPGGQ